jgi:hypothetical protein
MEVVIVGADLESRYVVVDSAHRYSLGMENPG